MKRVKAMAVVTAICAAGVGCCSCGPKMGYHFEIGRPSVLMSPTLLSPATTGYGMAGVATVPALGAALAAPVGLAATCGSAGGTLSADRLGRVAPDPCASITLDELCRRLVSLEAAVKAIRPPTGLQGPGKPMPRGNE